MCSNCDQALLLPAHGILRATGLVLKHAGADPDAVDQTIPGRLPARGGAMAIDTPDGLRLVRLQPDEGPEETARAESMRTGRPVGAGHVTAIGTLPDGRPVTAVAVHSVAHPVVDAGELWKGVTAPPGPLGTLVDIAKAPKLDPFNPTHFSRIAASLSKLVTDAAGKVEVAAMDTWLKGLAFDWSTATDAQLLQASTALNGAMKRAAGDVWTGVRGTLTAAAQKTAADAAASTAETHALAIDGRLSAIDRTAVNRAVSGNAHYIADYYGRISPALSAQMRNIVGVGIEGGMSEFEIADMIRRKMKRRLGKVSGSYYNIVSNAVVGRSRSYSQLRMFEDAKVERYTIEAILDQVTTNTCRFLHGKVMTVGGALKRYRDTDALKDPRDVRFTQPMTTERIIRSGKHKGKRGLYIPQRSGMERLAVIEQSAVGEWDKVGRFSNAKGPAALDQANVGAPPYHYRCRTVLLPYI